jgi:hypothetical protein
LQRGLEDNLEADVDDGYESEVEEDYLNQLEIALSKEPEEEVRSPMSHFYVPPVECDEEEDLGWSEEIGFSEHSKKDPLTGFWFYLMKTSLPMHHYLQVVSHKLIILGATS